MIEAAEKALYEINDHKPLDEVDQRVADQLFDAAESLRAHDVEDDEPAPLDETDCTWLPIVREGSTGYILVDGFSRTAGMIMHGAQSIPVIITDTDCDDIDCDTPIDHPVLRRIYAEAGEHEYHY